MRWNWTAYCGDENTQDEQGTFEAPCRRSAIEEMYIELGSRIGYDAANDFINDGDWHLKEVEDAPAPADADTLLCERCGEETSQPMCYQCQCEAHMPGGADDMDATLGWYEYAA